MTLAAAFILDVVKRAGRFYRAATCHLERQRRIVTRNWDIYDTRHAVYIPARMTPRQLEEGYQSAYRDFYAWSAISRASLAHGSLKHQAKHFFYAAGWKKFERAWNVVIRARQLRVMTPMLEAVLAKVSSADRRPIRSLSTSCSTPSSTP